MSIKAFSRPTIVMSVFKSIMSSPFASSNISFNEKTENDLVIDRAIAGLNKCFQQYKEKVFKCENLLDKLGFTVKDLPKDLTSDLKKTLEDDEGVFKFSRVSGKMVEISVNHVLDSLQEKYELGQLQMLSSQMETLVEEYSHYQSNLELQLNTEIEESGRLENKRFDKEAKLMMSNGKLETAKRELENLQQLSQGNQKPKFSLEELESLKQEVNKLKTEIAFTNTRLNKYNKLPLSEKDALKQLIKMKEELKNVDNEIRNILSCS